MPADRLLGTLLQVLQSNEPQDAPRLLGTAASLLTSLNNPLNVTLLTNQLLAAHALWARPDGLRFALNFMGVFHAAVKRVIQNDIEEVERKVNNKLSYQLPSEPHISLQRWVNAVLEGADHRTPSARHILAIGGTLLGLSGQDTDFAPRTTISKLQEAFIKATNAALHDNSQDELARLSIALAVNHAFPHLSDFERAQVNYDELLPLLMYATLRSREGLAVGGIVQMMQADVRQDPASRFSWPASSPSYQRLLANLSSPLVASVGAMSRLIAHAVENVRDPWLASSVIDDVTEFSANLHKQWRQSQLAAVNTADESLRLDAETSRKTLPDLLRLLRSTLFALVIVLRSVTGRLLADTTLGDDALAPQIAAQSLHCLRNLNFIFAKLGSGAFSQHTFVHLTCIDILNSYPAAATTFLRSIAPSESGLIPQHPVDRNSDLFFLDTAEHFTLILPTAQAESLLISSATPYLTSTAAPGLSELFEAAHSVMLAVFSAPQNAELTAQHLPFYVDALFKVFPQNLSARQFRLAFKNLIRIASPPGKMAEQQPMLAAILLDLLREQAVHASTAPLPQRASDGDGLDLRQAPALSEQAVLIQTLVDALPYIEIRLLEEWLALMPEMLSKVQDDRMREECAKHLWETMVGGAMDPERSQACVAWWTTGGGMEAIVYGYGGDEALMAGALPSAGRGAKM